MKKREHSNNKDRFDYKGYVSNLGKTGTFYKDKKDSKGVEGQLVSIAEKGVYAMVKNIPFPQLFARADFGTHGTVKCSCGKTFKLVEVKGSDKKNHKNNHSSGKNHYSVGNEYGKFDNSKQAKAMYSFLNWFEKEEPDLEDDDDCDQVVEKAKKFVKACY